MYSTYKKSPLNHLLNSLSVEEIKNIADKLKLTYLPIKSFHPIFGGVSEGRGGHITINNRLYLKNFRRKLRNNSTCAEAKLWSLLRKSQVNGKKFRRQHSIGNFILDFYCPTEKLAIELDGEIHFSAHAEEMDSIRTYYLNNYGIEVIRFENHLVFDEPEFVVSEIKKRFDHPLPPPLLRGELEYLTLFDIEEYLIGYYELNKEEFNSLHQIIPSKKQDFWKIVYQGRITRIKNNQ
jgi:very-short-patch-repair endonuclease